MGKITTYLIMISLLVIGFHYAGLITDTPISFLLDALLNPQNLQTNSWYVQIAGILAGFGGVAAVVIGSFAPSRIEQAATLAFTSLLFVVGWDLLAIFNQIKLINPVLAVFVMSPFIFVYILSAIEWWGGRD